jgi:hypothetical protein
MITVKNGQVAVSLISDWAIQKSSGSKSEAGVCKITELQFEFAPQRIVFAHHTLTRQCVRPFSNTVHRVSHQIKSEFTIS